MLSNSPQVAPPPPHDHLRRPAAHILVEHGPVEPRAVPAAVAFRMLGIGHTTGWKLIREGRLEALKIGRSTVITLAEIDRFLATAPRRVPASTTQETT